MKKSTAAGQHKSWGLSAEAVLIPLLHPGECLRIALSGATGWLEGVSLPDLVGALFSMLGGIPSSELNRTTYIGITDEDLVFAITKDPKKPSRVQRAPLGNVSIVKFKESRTPFLIDVLVIDTGKKRLTLSTASSLRPVIRELAAALSESQEAGKTDSARHLQRAPAEPAPPIHIRLFGRLVLAQQDIAATLRADGFARASLGASRYSISLFAVSMIAAVAFIFGAVALGSIVPTTPWVRFRDVLLFILFLPALLVALLSILAALVAAWLAIYSIFKKGEKALTVIGALVAAAALLIFYTGIAFVAVLLGGE